MLFRDKGFQIIVLIFLAITFYAIVAPKDEDSKEQPRRELYAKTDDPCPTPLQMVYIDDFVVEDNKTARFTVLFPTTGNNWNKETFKNIDLTGMLVNPIPFNCILENRLPVCLIVSNRYSRNASLFVPSTSSLPKE